MLSGWVDLSKWFFLKQNSFWSKVRKGTDIGAVLGRVH